MKKKIIIICAAVGVLLVCLSCVLIYLNSDQRVDITCIKHQGFDTDINLGKLSVESYSTTPRAGMNFVPSNDDDVKALVENSEYYLLQDQFYVEGAKVSGWLLYKDNNLYLLYQRRNSNEYRFVNLCSEYDQGDISLYFPCVSISSFSMYDIELADGYYNIMDFVFAEFDYEQCKSIYSNFSDDYVSFNDNEQQIRVVGYDDSSKSTTEYPCIVFDFINSEIGYVDESGIISYLK